MKFLKKLVGNSKDYTKMANAVGNVKAILDNIEQSYTADKEVFLIAAWICRVGIIDIIEKNNWTMNYKLLVRINGCNVSITFHEAYLMTIGRLSIKAEEQNNEIKELFTNATVKIGEKLDLRRFEIVKLSEGQGFGTYIHMGGKISVLVVTNPGNENAKGLAMHIAANNPLYLNKESIPADVLNHELAIQMEAAKTDEKLQNKPEAVIAKIVEGKVNKQLSETTLSEQEYLLEPGQTVSKFLKDNNETVVRFVRYMVGEGIEKRKDDFASEVMSQIK